MAGVTAGRLLRLGEQHLLVTDQHAAQRLEFVGETSQRVRSDDGRVAGNLNDASVQGDLSVEGRRPVDHAVPPHHRGLDHVANHHLDHERYDAGIGKINAIDGLVCLGHDRAENEVHVPEMTARPQQRCFAEAN